MNDLITDIKNLELETLKNLRSSKAANTLRAYKADYKDFARFCFKTILDAKTSKVFIISLIGSKRI